MSEAASLGPPRSGQRRAPDGLSGVGGYPSSLAATSLPLPAGAAPFGLRRGPPSAPDGESWSNNDIGDRSASISAKATKRPSRRRSRRMRPVSSCRCRLDRITLFRPSDPLAVWLREGLSPGSKARQWPFQPSHGRTEREKPSDNHRDDRDIRKRHLAVRGMRVSWIIQN